MRDEAAGCRRPRLPAAFSWREKRDVETVLGVEGRRYALNCVNQHEKGWCGACYFVSAVQVACDRGWIARAKCGRAETHTVVEPPLPLLQPLFDAYDAWARPRMEKTERGWNACQGGWAEDVLRFLKTTDLESLAFEKPGVSFSWNGFPSVPVPTSSPSSRPPPPPPFRITGYGRLRACECGEEALKDEIMEDGPLVLEISFVTSKRLDERGVVSLKETKRTRTINHVVSVVGWNEEGWIARNTWGKDDVPIEFPKDRTCVSRSGNTCRVGVERWHGMPGKRRGFFVVPFGHPAVSHVPERRPASPWIRVRLRAA